MAKYLITDASHPLAAEIAEGLRKDGNEVILNSKDITTRDAIKALVAETGTVDGLIISGYANSREKLDGGNPDIIAEMARKNIMSAFHAARHYGALMVENGGGRIVFLSSIFADKPTGSNPAYSLSQGAAQMFMKELSLFFGNQGVTVNMIKLAPSEKETETFASDIVSATYDIPSKAPVRRYVGADDALAALRFLLSDAACGVNGADLKVDGGLLYFYFDRGYSCRKESEL